MIGIIGKEPITEAIYQGLVHLQHRGQDAAGIFAYDPVSGHHELYKNRGLVSQVFNAETLPLPEASWGIGHVRYSTIGTGKLEDSHPLVMEGQETLSLAHNGNIVNYLPLKEELERKGSSFETTCDAEVLLHLFAEGIKEKEISFDSVCHSVKSLLKKTTGSYSVVGMIKGHGLFAFRDPWGLRPLLFASLPDQKMHAVASETGALSSLGFEQIADIQPGELIYVDSEHRVYRKVLMEQSHAFCSFEYNYFAKPNAILEEREVYRIRSRLGIALAEKCRDQGIDAEVVIPIPDSSRPSAISLAYHLSIPLEEGFVKQNHVGRTFIMPTQYARKRALSQKLVTVKSVFEGKSVILVDDSIVRGTVSRRVIELAKRAGAKEIYFASTFPPIRHPCLYGIDFPQSEELAAYNRSIEEIAENIGANGLVYNDQEGLERAIGMTELCTACLSGKYPTPMCGQDELTNLRQNAMNEMELACKQ